VYREEGKKMLVNVFKKHPHEKVTVCEMINMIVDTRSETVIL